MYNVTPSFVSILVYALHYSSSSVYYYHYYYYYYYYCYCYCYCYYYYYDYASDNDDYYGVDLKRPATKSGHPCLVPGSGGRLVAGSQGQRDSSDSLLVLLLRLLRAACGRPGLSALGCALCPFTGTEAAYKTKENFALESDRLLLTVEIPLYPTTIGHKSS